MTIPVMTIMPKDLSDIGLKVKFGNGEYICYDLDGLEMRRFEMKYQAFQYLRETFEAQLKDQ